MPFRYPVVEVLTAGLCAFIGYRYGLTLPATVLIIYCALFVHFTFVDLEHSLILNKVVLPALPLSIALFPFSPLGQSWDIGEAYLRSLEGAGLGFGIMLLVYIASRGHGRRRREAGGLAGLSPDSGGLAGGLRHWRLGGHGGAGAET